MYDSLLGLVVFSEKSHGSLVRSISILEIHPLTESFVLLQSWRSGKKKCHRYSVAFAQGALSRRFVDKARFYSWHIPMQ